MRSFLEAAIPKVWLSSEKDVRLQFCSNFLKILVNPILQSNTWIKRNEKGPREKQLPRIIDSKEPLTLPVGCSDNFTVNWSNWCTWKMHKELQVANAVFLPNKWWQNWILGTEKKRLLQPFYDAKKITWVLHASLLNWHTNRIFWSLTLDRFPKTIQGTSRNVPYSSKQKLLKMLAGDSCQNLANFQDTPAPQWQASRSLVGYPSRTDCLVCSST